MTIRIALLIAVAALISCSSYRTIPPPDDQKQEQRISEARVEANAIVLHTQSVLLEHVQRAMREGGPSHAVAYCNERAVSITDSISMQKGVTVQRLSLRNRNPLNEPVSPDEVRLLESFKARKKNGIVPGDSLIMHDRTILFYKPIVVAMPACLRCHGVVGTDVDEETAAMIKSRYPNDKATGYSLGDLRGMWKVVLPR